MKDHRVSVRARETRFKVDIAPTLVFLSLQGQWKGWVQLKTTRKMRSEKTRSERTRRTKRRRRRLFELETRWLKNE